MKRLLIICAIMMVAFTTGAESAKRPEKENPDRRLENARQVPDDFIHTPCVFDTLLTTFRRLAAFYAPPGRKAGSAWIDYIGFASYRWEVPSLSNRGFVAGSLPYYPNGGLRPDKRAARDTAVAAFVRTVEALHRQADWSSETEKAHLVRQLEAFDDTATVLPWVYAVIKQKYRGNVQAYVDALFKRSVMTSRRRLRHFAKSPTPSRMLDDFGIQFAVSKLMFRLWEQQGRPANLAPDGTRLVILRSELDAMTK